MPWVTIKWVVVGTETELHDSIRDAVLSAAQSASLVPGKKCPV